MLLRSTPGNAPSIGFHMLDQWQLRDDNEGLWKIIARDEVCVYSLAEWEVLAWTEA
jgi:hypothetical protein